MNKRDNRSLFVCYIPKLMTRYSFIQLFKPFGRISEWRFLKSYAFVKYENEMDALRAVRTLNGLNVFDKRLKVEVNTHRNGPNILIDGINKKWTERNVFEFFSCYGAIAVHLLNDEIANKCYAQTISAVPSIKAYVLFNSYTAARETVNMLNGKYLPEQEAPLMFYSTCRPDFKF